MRVDYCPRCDKAGLRYDDEQGRDAYGAISEQRYVAFRLGIPTFYGKKKWCKRCQEWVTPRGKLR